MTNPAPITPELRRYCRSYLRRVERLRIVSEKMAVPLWATIRIAAADMCEVRRKLDRSCNGMCARNPKAIGAMGWVLRRSGKHVIGVAVIDTACAGLIDLRRVFGGDAVIEVTDSLRSAICEGEPDREAYADLRKSFVCRVPGARAPRPARLPRELLERTARLRRSGLSLREIAQRLDGQRSARGVLYLLDRHAALRASPAADAVVVADRPRPQREPLPICI